jgi:hypothetical protein
VAVTSSQANNNTALIGVVKSFKVQALGETLRDAKERDGERG